MAFNLFGDLAGDLVLADRAVHAWWPDAPPLDRLVTRGLSAASGKPGAALRLDGDFGSVVVKLLPVLAQPAHFTLPTRLHRPQQPPERLLMARLAQVT